MTIDSESDDDEIEEIELVAAEEGDYVEFQMEEDDSLNQPPPQANGPDAQTIAQAVRLGTSSSPHLAVRTWPRPSPWLHQWTVCSLPQQRRKPPPTKHGSRPRRLRCVASTRSMNVSRANSSMELTTPQ